MSDASGGTDRPAPRRPARVLAATAVAASLPYLAVLLFPSLDRVMEPSSYLVFHNVAEFFSIMVSLSVFGVGWFTFDQSKDRHALFLGTAFLAVGLIDFMHVQASAAMPAFITPNSTGKSSQYWIAARLVDSSALLASAFIARDRPLPWLGKGTLLSAALAASAAVFVAITFFPAHLPQTFVPGVGLTPFKVICEYVVIALLLLAAAAYWRRMRRTGDTHLVRYQAAFVVAAFGEAAFASYAVAFGTHNVLGHLYKVLAFYLIYERSFAASVRTPYLHLTRANERLRREILERQAAEDAVRALNAGLEQRVAERTAQARAHAAELETILNCVADGVIVYDGEGRTVRSTPAADRILGVPLAERRAPVQERVMRQYAMFSEDGRRLGKEELVAVRAAQRGETVRDEIQEMRRVGSDEARWLSLNASPITAEGRHVGAVLSFTDITRRKQAEQELRRAEQALRHANDQLRDADQRKDEFLGMLSHELRNPLAAARNALYVLGHARPGGPQAQRAQAVIDRQTRQLTRLVDDLLDVTRIARGKVELRRSRIDLREVVSRTTDDLRSTMEERGITFRVALPAARVWADADPARVTQIVTNLLHNASKFTPRGGTVELSLCVEAGRACLSVRDTGAGIPPALLPRVFDPFVQGDRSLTHAHGGLGLGLALVRGLAELHGGTASAESAGEGRGAQLTVALPIAEPPVHPVEEPDRGRPHRARRVLVVDDNRDGAESLAQVVEILGHAAEVAYDGTSAMEKARSNPPEVVLCDIGLPDMSGYELAKRLRAARADIQLIAVSGYAQAGDVLRATASGFDGHVAKPVDVADIGRLLG